MTPDELAAIEGRLLAVESDLNQEPLSSVEHRLLVQDIPALLVEVRRLRAALAVYGNTKRWKVSLLDHDRIEVTEFLGDDGFLADEPWLPAQQALHGEQG